MRCSDSWSRRRGFSRTALDATFSEKVKNPLLEAVFLFMILSNPQFNDDAEICIKICPLHRKEVSRINSVNFDRCLR